MLYDKLSANQPGKSAVVALGAGARAAFTCWIFWFLARTVLVACRRRRGGFSTSRCRTWSGVQSHLAFSTVTHDATKFLYFPSGVESERKV